MTPNKTYHIYNHGNADDNLFRSEENYRYFIQKYNEFIYPIANTYAYCLLPNHFHFLIKIKGGQIDKVGANNSIKNIEKSIVKYFSNFFNAYTRAFNIMYDRRGKLFLTPFKRKPVTNQRHLINTWKYIHFNPVHHRFVDDSYEWPHSSIHDYRLKESKWLDLLDVTENSMSLNDFNPDWNDFLDLEY